MNYLVMECHTSYVVLLDEQGRFLRAANLCYQVGQTVQDPVLMEDVQTKPRSHLKWISAGVAAIAACLALVFGLQTYQNYWQAYSSILLSINPQVQMDLNRQGDVVALTGMNEDGVTLLEGYDGRGKDKVTVADELIDRAIDMGFLSEGGQISFSIDAPDQVLFQEYGVQLRTQVQEHLSGRITVNIQIISGGSPSQGSSSQEAPAGSTTPSSSSSSSPGGDSGYGDSGYGDSGYGTSSSAGGTGSTTGGSGGSTSSRPSSSASSGAAPAADPDDGDTNYNNSDTNYDDSGTTDYGGQSGTGDSGYGDDDDNDDEHDDDDD